MVTTLRPDLVVWSQARKRVEIVELTVPWETRLEYEHERKAEKYAELVAEVREQNWKCELSCVEVGCRGFIGESMVKWMKRIGLKGRGVKGWQRKIEEVVEGVSGWIVLEHSRKGRQTEG